MTPGTPHSSLPPQGYPDDKRHMSYYNGPPPTMERQQSYPPPTPLSHQHPDYYLPAYGQPHGEPGIPIHITHSGKRKAQRASQVGI